LIVFCHLLNDRSGSPTVLSSTLNALDAHNNGLLYVGSQGQGVLDENDVPIRHYWYRRSLYRPITFFTYFASQVSLYRSLSRSQDSPLDATVFVNTLLPFAAMLWGRRTRRRVIVHIHEISIMPRLLSWFLKRCAARSAELLIYVSKDHFSRLIIKGPESRIIPNPVSPLLVARVNEKNSRQLGRFRVLMLASPRLYKGIKEFFALAADLQARTDITFDLVLNADPKEVETIAECQTDAVNITIYPRTNDTGRFYLEADLVMNLSRVDQWIETFGLTIVEAMTFGIPVITPPIGGPAEIVTHGVEGYCIDSRDGVALRKAVLALADDMTNYSAMSQAALLRAKNFTYDAYAVALRDALIGLDKVHTK
jgi:glycosyltransferase involved in cell wall biosynthesis